MTSTLPWSHPPSLGSAPGGPGRLCGGRERRGQRLRRWRRGRHGGQLRGGAGPVAPDDGRRTVQGTHGIGQDHALLGR